MMRTLVLIKPDAYERGIIGELITRFEKKGLTILALKLMLPSLELVEAHYAEHRDKLAFIAICGVLINNPTIAMVLQGSEAVEVVRTMTGHTSRCRECRPGTIRGDYGMSSRFTVVHASDSEEAAKREIPLWFKDDEILSYVKVTESWVHSTLDP